MSGAHPGMARSAGSERRAGAPGDITGRSLNDMIDHAFRAGTFILCWFDKPGMECHLTQAREVQLLHALGIR
jgi:hypothetical protein